MRPALGSKARLTGLVVLLVRDGLFSKQIVLQFFRESRILAPNPFEHHRRVFLLLVTVMLKNRLEFLVLASISALVVPVNGLQLFHQLYDGPVHVACFL